MPDSSRLVKNLCRFLADVRQLAVREMWKIRDEYFAVIAQRQEGWSRPLTVPIENVRELETGRRGGVGPAEERRRVVRWDLSKGIGIDRMYRRCYRKWIRCALNGLIEPN